MTSSATGCATYSASLAIRLTRTSPDRSSRASRPVPSPWARWRSVALLRLGPGLNRLLIKLASLSNQWPMCRRLLGRRVQNLKHWKSSPARWARRPPTLPPLPPRVSSSSAWRASTPIRSCQHCPRPSGLRRRRAWNWGKRQIYRAISSRAWVCLRMIWTGSWTSSRKPPAMRIPMSGSWAKRLKWLGRRRRRRAWISTRRPPPSACSPMRACRAVSAARRSTRHCGR